MYEDGLLNSKVSTMAVIYVRCCDEEILKQSMLLYVNFMRCISHLINMIKLKVFQQKKQHSRYGFHYDFLKTNLQG